VHTQGGNGSEISGMYAIRLFDCYGVDEGWLVMMCAVLAMLVGHHGRVSVEQNALGFHHRPTMGPRREETPRFRAENVHTNEEVLCEGFLRYRMRMKVGIRLMTGDREQQDN